MESFPSPFSAVVIGAGGGLGAALTRALAQSPACTNVLAFSRRTAPPMGEKIAPGAIDLSDEASIAAAAAHAQALPNLRLVIIASGLLHGPGFGPEKSMKELSLPTLMQVMTANALGPALCLKHFAPLAPRDGKSVLAALSARVGSISDNRLGGWYAYRASKAALNQFVRTAAIELAARRKDALCIGLHPGTVDTGMSQPFLANYRANEVFTPKVSAAHLLRVIDQLESAQTGGVFGWDGAAIPA